MPFGPDHNPLKIDMDFVRKKLQKYGSQLTAADIAVLPPEKKAELRAFLGLAIIAVLASEPLIVSYVNAILYEHRLSGDEDFALAAALYKSEFCALIQAANVGEIKGLMVQ